MKHSIAKKLFIYFLLCTCILSACKKAENFYETLQGLPQVDQSEKYAYKSSYLEGDTLNIVGNLQPDNKLVISVGNVDAPIVKTERISYKYDKFPNIKTGNMDRVSLIITKSMLGLNREVKISINGVETLGPSINVYGYGGLGSFDGNLKSILIKDFGTISNKNTFFYCINGKGDIYYYSPDSKDILHIKKDGTEEVLFSLTNCSDQKGDFNVDQMIAGAVDTQGKNLYFSVLCSDKTYRFCQVDLATKSIKTLNRSAEIAAPYSNVLSDNKIIINGIYPNAKGYLYLTIAEAKNIVPQAIASFNPLKDKFSFLLKNETADKAMPGTQLSLRGNEHIESVRFSADEDLLYALKTDNFSNIHGVDVYDLNTITKQNNFYPQSTSGPIPINDAIGGFASLKLNLNYSPTQMNDYNFGFLPLPGKRVIFMLYQKWYAAYPPLENTDFPKWLVFDFAKNQSYAYHRGKYIQSGLLFHSSFADVENDELLNYDEEGHLYATAMGKTKLIKTKQSN